jgi:hypothetical protein
MAMYESEITVFLRQLREQRPHLVDEQRKGRAIWWDKPQDLETTERQRASRVPQQPYVYQTRD